MNWIYLSLALNVIALIALVVSNHKLKAAIKVANSVTTFQVPAGVDTVTVYASAQGSGGGGGAGAFRGVTKSPPGGGGAGGAIIGGQLVVGLGKSWWRDILSPHENKTA